MATRDFLLPDLGEGLTEAEIVTWLVAVGDTVAVDQALCEVETAKAVVEVPAPFAGRITTLHGEAGQEIAVGTPLVTIEVATPATADGPPGQPAEPTPAPAQPAATDGDAPAQPAATAGDELDPAAAMSADASGRAAAASGDASGQVSGSGRDVPGKAGGGPGASGQEEQAGSLVPDAAATVDGDDQGTVTGRTGDGDGGSGNVLVGYGTGGGRARRRGRSAPPDRGGPSGPPRRTATPAPTGAAAIDARPLAKPPVRKLAKDLGIDLRQVQPTGPHGTISRDDVHKAAQQVPEGHQRLLEPGNGVVVTDPEHTPLGSAPPNEERIPVRGVRRAISEKMSRSRREIPEATTWVDVDASGLWELRQRLAARHPDHKITPFAIILRAVVAGLRRHPTLNARLDTASNEIVVSHQVHLGFAAQTDRGLVVPVIRDADRRSLLDLAQELTRLTAAARDGSVTPDELTGSTFTVSNYGAFGVDGGSAIINHPEAAILGVGRITDKPWVVDGALAVRKVCQLSIAFDHRIIDGGEAAGFLRFSADCVEDPDALLAAL